MIFFLLQIAFALPIQDLFEVEMNPENKYFQAKFSLENQISLINQKPEVNLVKDHSGYLPSSLNKSIFFRTQESVLNDFDQRISNDFSVPPSLKRRVSFWLDIYTKYDDNYVVLHDRMYPWVVYEVFNRKELMKGEGSYWTRYHKSEKHILRRKIYWSNLIAKLAQKKSKTYSADEKHVLLHFKRPKYLRQASKRIRSQTGQRNHFVLGLEKAAKHLPEIELIFSQKNLPVELTRLPLVESSFNPKAHSKAGAKGIWQIMPAMARNLNLLTSKKDMRTDILASSRAAATLLQQKHRMLKAWPLTVTAYNHGPSGIRNAIKKLSTRNITDIVRNYDSRRFGFASQNFYASFLAALYAERYQDVFFHDLEKTPLVAQDEKPKNKAL